MVRWTRDGWRHGSDKLLLAAAFSWSVVSRGASCTGCAVI